MPASPAEDRPLVEAPFPDSPMRVLLETRINPRRHPGLEDEPVEPSELPPVSPELFRAPSTSEPAITPAFIAQSFDPDSVVPPPRPRSSFEDHPEGGFSESGDDQPAFQVPEADQLPPPSVTRSTFIEAARRAAQRQAQAVNQQSGGNSLIGRALARFQQPRGEPKPIAEAMPKPERPAKAKKEKRPAKSEPSLADAAEGKNEPFTATESLPTDVVPVPPRPKPETAPATEGFLSRHRQPILLVASVVALSFLTLNLVSQRMSEGSANLATGGNDAVVPEAVLAQPAPSAESDTSAMVAQPAADEPPPAAAPKVQAANAAPRVVGMIDSLATGSINAAATRFTPSVEMPPVAQAFQATGNTEATDPSPPGAIESPVKVDMPAEGVGPIELRQAAADGDTRAQFEVGAIYTEGRAVPKDLKLAAMWYERAAAQGFAPAQYRLGNLYENGLGVTKDLEQARLWYQRAAEAGNRMSMHNLAALYAGGQLGKQDFAAAAEWFEKAANQGLTDSQFNLGMLYARGLGVPQNMETSYKWFALAARNGDKDAASARDDIAKSLLADNVSTLSAEVAAWKPEPIDLAANFAPIGTWSANFDPGETIKKRDVVLGVQTLLRRLGYDVGTPDGVAGPKTADAIRQFEKATGMNETGAVNPRLLAVLSSQPV
jgi:localization factor PodJL